MVWEYLNAETGKNTLYYRSNVMREKEKGKRSSFPYMAFCGFFLLLLYLFGLCVRKCSVTNPDEPSLLCQTVTEEGGGRKYPKSFELRAEPRAKNKRF